MAKPEDRKANLLDKGIMKKVLLTVLIMSPLVFLQGCNATVAERSSKTTKLTSDPLGLFDDYIKESFIKIGAHPKTIELNYVMEKSIEGQETIGYFQRICAETRAFLNGRFREFTNPAPQIRIYFSASELPGLSSSFLDCEKIK